MSNSALKHGTKINISARRQRESLLPCTKGEEQDRNENRSQNFYVRGMRDGEMVGNLFATLWRFGECESEEEEEEERGLGLWITQLFVHREYRDSDVGRDMLEELRSALLEEKWEQDRDEETERVIGLGSMKIKAVGVLSANPFTLSDVMSVFGKGIGGFEDEDFKFLREEGREVMRGCPVEYVRGAKVEGSLFQEGRERGEEGEKKEGAVSCADTGFWIDHGESEEALRTLERRRVKWPFGTLPDGCEYLVIVRPR
ncbi:hypothetical protein EG329_008695 [Mollisiaceae sp. DMI_Dod_QoI]|nr:hypothetical protein EG329_008695 [Helotiales sp. DMI_Dod_QoI]